MAGDRMKMILHHLNPKSSSAMHAFGVQNPIEAVGFKNNYYEPKRIAKQNFKFTGAGGKLSTEQQIFYENNGFVVIQNLVPQEFLDKYLHRFQEIAANVVNIPGLTIMKDVSFITNRLDEKVINKIQDFVFDDVLFEYCKLPQILEYVESFCGPNIKAMHTMLINKPPDSGSLSSRHPLHQDLHYFPFRPADKIVCAWTAMERVSRSNGCLVVIPGSHKGELLNHDYPDWQGGVNKLYHGVTNMERNSVNQRVYLEMEAGDTVFFHPILIHGSGTNRTEHFRKAISCHYAACECYYIDVKGTSQQKMADEILEVAKRKGIDLDDVKYAFQARGKLVQGKEVTL